MENAVAENGALANFIIVLVVSIHGIFWLFNHSQIPELEYRYRAYRYWWCSWVVWCLVWILLYKKSTYQNPAAFVPSLDIPVLVFDNLNSIFLIIVYFVITRGRNLTSRQARTLTIYIIFSVGILYGTVYFIFNNFYLAPPKFAYEIHRSFSLSIAVFTPILVGWAFKLRFKTSIVLIIGCLYGLIQPVIYATELNTFQQPGYEEFQKALINIKPAVAMIVALLKIVWVIVFTKVLQKNYASSESLILSDETELPHVWKSKNLSLLLQSLILIGVFIILLFAFQVKNYNAFIATFGVGFLVIITISGLWKFIWWGLKITEETNLSKKYDQQEIKKTYNNSLEDTKKILTHNTTFFSKHGSAFYLLILTFVGSSIAYLIKADDFITMLGIIVFAVIGTWFLEYTSRVRLIVLTLKQINLHKSKK